MTEQKQTLINGKLTKENKIIAYGLLPLYMVGLFLITYSLSLAIGGGQFDYISLFVFIIGTCSICYVANPKFNTFEFNEIYITNANLPLIEKIKKFKGVFLFLGGLSVATGILFGFT
ncbi:energy-converting hydrogenase Eha subunit C [Alkalihalobacillus xiaoxiensis]|uniref:Energy-converting hydrogenase Eha subunit C n=1 Tax=Shouchella xiaoxiensis TaxID=766895 RepID=A0ABS2SXH1_9BACI|nr:hypothetical protein [Shouchella xiaoxiensis]MBM7839896.1 energy-converting hydrogenase Eha subunit C [Shouchella xiaoxiensis]